MSKKEEVKVEKSSVKIILKYKFNENSGKSNEDLQRKIKTKSTNKSPIRTKTNWEEKRRRLAKAKKLGQARKMVSGSFVKLYDELEKNSDDTGVQLVRNVRQGVAKGRQIVRGVKNVRKAIKTGKLPSKLKKRAPIKPKMKFGGKVLNFARNIKNLPQKLLEQAIKKVALKLVSAGVIKFLAIGLAAIILISLILSSMIIIISAVLSPFSWLYSEDDNTEELKKKIEVIQHKVQDTANRRNLALENDTNVNKVIFISKYTDDITLELISYIMTKKLNIKEKIKEEQERAAKGEKIEESEMSKLTKEFEDLSISNKDVENVYSLFFKEEIKIESAMENNAEVKTKVIKITRVSFDEILNEYDNKTKQKKFDQNEIDYAKEVVKELGKLSLSLGLNVETIDTSKINEKFAYPAPNAPIITSGYGPRIHPTLKIVKDHSGIDLAGPNCETTPIVSIYDGEVIYIEKMNQFVGNVIKIKHHDESGDFYSRYLHLYSIGVKVGDKVTKGQEIAKLGNTGEWTTGAHLHFEFYLSDPNKTVNPAIYLFKLN